MENDCNNIKTDNIEISKIEDASFSEIKDTDDIEDKRNYFDKNYVKIKWSFGVYHIVFGIWSIVILFQIIFNNLLSIIFAIPLITYIVCSILGGYRLIKNDKRSINLLLVAQIPQILLLQINGFFYSLISGQWIIFTILKKDIVKFGFNFGVLRSSYNFIFNSTFEGNGFGINIVPIIAILILL
jgi:hypothetical protein